MLLPFSRNRKQPNNANVLAREHPVENDPVWPNQVLCYWYNRETEVQSSTPQKTTCTCMMCSHPFEADSIYLSIDLSIDTFHQTLWSRWTRQWTRGERTAASVRRRLAGGTRGRGPQKAKASCMGQGCPDHSGPTGTVFAAAKGGRRRGLLGGSGR